MLNRRYEKILWQETMAMQQNTFNETFDSYIRVYQRAAKEATKDREGPIGPFQNCMVCSVPPGGKNMEGRYIYASRNKLLFVAFGHSTSYRVWLKHFLTSCFDAQLLQNHGSYKSVLLPLTPWRKLVIMLDAGSHKHTCPLLWTHSLDLAMMRRWILPKMTF